MMQVLIVSATVRTVLAVGKGKVTPVIVIREVASASITDFFMQFPERYSYSVFVIGWVHIFYGLPKNLKGSMDCFIIVLLNS